jgi:hypothetical protein
VSTEQDHGRRRTRTADFIAPLGYAAAIAEPDWRERLAWPISLSDSYLLGRDRLRRIVATTAGMAPGDARLIAIASCGQAFAAALPLIELAAAIQAAGHHGADVVGDTDLLKFLKGQLALEQMGAFALRRLPKPPSYAALRRCARTKSWTSWPRLARALLRPDAVAIAHNELLHEAAAFDGLAVGFYHAESFLLAARNCAAPALAEAHRREACEVLIRAIVPYPPLDAALADRLALLVSARIDAITRLAAADLGSMRAARHLPGNVWAGSGGHWPTRLTALEALRRGGDVTIFDHGHNRALHDILEFPAAIDLFAASRLVTPTSAMAQRMQTPQLRAFLPADRSPVIVGREGDRGLADLLRATRQRAPSGSRARVLYAPHILRGLRQTVPASLPDLVYLDWQLRLVERLREACVDLMIRPHPQGIFASKQHPLDALVPTERRNFELLLPESDILLFDCPYSRVFCKALVTDRPIVLIDFGVPYFAPDVAPMIERRCHVLTATYDERNRPQIDYKLVTDALNSTAQPPAEAITFFRRLMVGEAVLCG